MQLLRRQSCRPYRSYLPCHSALKVLFKAPCPSWWTHSTRPHRRCQSRLPSVGSSRSSRPVGPAEASRNQKCTFRLKRMKKTESEGEGATRLLTSSSLCLQAQWFQPNRACRSRPNRQLLGCLCLRRQRERVPCTAAARAARRAAVVAHPGGLRATSLSIPQFHQPTKRKATTFLWSICTYSRPVQSSTRRSC